MNKKKLGVTLGSLALVGAIGFGATLAYLSDQTQTLNNTFVIGDKIDIELEKKILLVQQVKEHKRVMII